MTKVIERSYPTRAEALQVECPRCDALAGEPCVTKTGDGNHRQRYMEALRVRLSSRSAVRTGVQQRIARYIDAYGGSSSTHDLSCRTDEDLLDLAAATVEELEHRARMAAS